MEFYVSVGITSFVHHSSALILTFFYHFLADIHGLLKKMDVKIDFLFEEIASLKTSQNSNQTHIEIDPLFELPELPIKTEASFLLINNNCLNAVYRDQLVC